MWIFLIAVSKVKQITDILLTNFVLVLFKCISGFSWPLIVPVFVHFWMNFPNVFVLQLDFHLKGKISIFLHLMIATFIVILFKIISFRNWFYQCLYTSRTCWMHGFLFLGCQTCSRRRNIHQTQPEDWWIHSAGWLWMGHGRVGRQGQRLPHGPH